MNDRARIVRRTILRDPVTAERTKLVQNSYAAGSAKKKVNLAE